MPDRKPNLSLTQASPDFLVKALETNSEPCVESNIDPEKIRQALATQLEAGLLSSKQKDLIYEIYNKNIAFDGGFEF